MNCPKCNSENVKATGLCIYTYPAYYEYKCNKHWNVVYYIFVVFYNKWYNYISNILFIQGGDFY